MHTLLALLLFVVVFVVPNQVTAGDGGKEAEVEKRQVSVLARDGNLPFAGKRYVEEKKPATKLSEKWNVDTSSSDPSVFLLKKRYVGALAKTGDLRFKQQQDKREDVDTLIDELLTAEELKRIRLEALRDELLREREEEEQEEGLDAEKRSLSSLARSGGFPFTNDKRSIASMAKAGYLRQPFLYSGDEYDKRGVSSLARNGQLPSFGKRGGISSLVRNGYSNNYKRSYDSDFDDLLLDEYDVNEKRNVASLARTYSLPSMGKRSISSFARNGWLQDFGSSSKKSVYDDWDDAIENSKRNLPSLLRNRVSPLVAGKRYLGAFIASNGLPYTRQNFDDSKRNYGSMVRSWNRAEPYRYGKRDWYDDETANEEIAKRYVSSLLKQGPLPVASDNIETNSENTQNYNSDQQSNDENTENMDEQKRHIGSLLAQKSFAMRKKKSITPEDQFGEQPPTVRSPAKSLSDENKMDNEIQQHNRQKREALADFAASEEFSMPVMQNTDVSEYDDGNSRASVDEQTTRKKRYFAVRGGGKIPGGRLPHVGRSRSNNPNSGRRRH